MEAKEQNFKLSDGTTYFLKGNIDYDIVYDYLVSQSGYCIDKVISNSRYLVLKISNDKGEYIFKLSSSEGINRMLLNEYSFNKLLHKEAKSTEYLRVPKVYDQGSINNLEYIITENYQGDKLCDIVKKVNGVVIDNLVKSILFIDSFTGKFVYRNEIEDENSEVYTKVSEKADKYIEIAKNFISETDVKYNVSSLLPILENYKQMNEIGFCHNEFDPENIILNNSVIHLYHGERSSGRSPKYYDVAVLYEKIYCSYGMKDIADEFLRCFMDSMKEEDKEYLKIALITMIASRLIGGYWEYSKGVQKEIDSLEKLKINILNNKLV